MFGSAKKFVRRRKLCQIAFRQMLTIRQPRQADQRVRTAKPFIPTAMCKLQRLGEKFYFTNTAPAEFYIEPGAFKVFQVDFFLRTAHIRKGGFRRFVGRKNKVL